MAPSEVVKSFIVSSVFPLVMKQVSATVCWETLDQHLSPQATFNSWNLREELMHLCKIEDMSLSHYLIKVHELTDQLANLESR